MLVEVADALVWATQEWKTPAIDRDPAQCALVLSFPPHAPEPIGKELLGAWFGKWLVYIGEHEIDDDHG
eukprot:4582943-Amphidinium_carterae.1